MMAPGPIATWAIGCATIAAVVVRPFGRSETLWAVAGAVLLVVTGSMQPLAALGAVGRSLDVGAFLVGMMIFSQIAVGEGIFAWIASVLLRRANGSALMLFALLYAIGIAITALLSNDATAIALTPAVLIVVRSARLEPRPYVYACVFVANAASFILPISNPANVVMFGRHAPPLGTWIATFGAAAAVAVAGTFAIVLGIFWNELRASRPRRRASRPIERRGAIVGALLALALAGVVAASALGMRIGVATLALAAVPLVATAAFDVRSVGSILARVSWGTIAFVAALFVVVTALDASGFLTAAQAFAAHAARVGVPLGNLEIAAAVTAASAAINNLPVALVGERLFASSSLPQTVRDSWLVAADLGPSVAVSGSLATLLWLAIVRRAGVRISALEFLRVGLLVAVPTTLAAAFVVR